MVPHTHEAIAIRSTGNFNGTHKFFCPNMGQILKGRALTKFSVLDRVMNKVDKQGLKTKKEVYGNQLEFCNQLNEKYVWEYDDNLDGLSQEERTLPHPDVPAKFPGVQLEADYEGTVPEVEEEFVNENEASVVAAATAGIQHLHEGRIQDTLAVRTPNEAVGDDDNASIKIEKVQSQWTLTMQSINHVTKNATKDETNNAMEDENNNNATEDKNMKILTTQ